MSGTPPSAAPPPRHGAPAPCPAADTPARAGGRGARALPPARPRRRHGRDPRAGDAGGDGRARRSVGPERCPARAVGHGCCGYAGLAPGRKAAIRGRAGGGRARPDAGARARGTARGHPGPPSSRAPARRRGGARLHAVCHGRRSALARAMGLGLRHRHAGVLRHRGRGRRGPQGLAADRRHAGGRADRARGGADADGPRGRRAAP